MRRDQLQALDDVADAIELLHGRLEEMSIEDPTEAAGVSQVAEFLDAASETITRLYIDAAAVPTKQAEIGARGLTDERL